MSVEQNEYYEGEASGNNWEEGDDGLQALMNAAADADARDNEAYYQGDEISKPRSPENTTYYQENDSGGVSGFYGETSGSNSSNSSKKREIRLSSDSNISNHSDNKKHRYELNNYAQTHLEASSEVKYSRKSSQLEYSSPLNNRKRHYESDEEEKPLRFKNEDGNYIERRSEGHANVVAEHYNTLKEKGLDERLKSRIFYMRNFNNWIKSMLINEYLNKIKDGLKHNSPIKVMDMCCGKGGDLLKWRKGNISYLICTDIASVSLEQCESRYKEMCSRNARERNAGRIYTAEFISADCTRVHLRKKYKDPSMKLDLVSCQFAFHYSFESLPQAECMLKNASESLQAGGFLIGTIPNADDIVARQRIANTKIFGNDVYQITFLCNSEKPPLFGAKYNFHLDGVVDCPEFLVYFPMFVKLAKKYGLQLVNVERFDDFYQRMKSEGCGLLNKMQSLETYPPFEDSALMGTADDDYDHCNEFIKQKQMASNAKIGTLSKSEWEAASLYLTFAFKKAKTTYDAKGNPKYVFT